jgi:hypothetical protein
MKRPTWTLFGALLCGLAALGAAAPAARASDEEKAVQKKPLVEIAILLDTSNSMDGLIDQARARLWSIVNTIALSKRNGETPDLRVALFEYGNSGLSAAEGFIRMVVPLSRDLDKISAELFALKTMGGDEFCGQVIRAAVERLDWTPGDAYRAIFIAGNEPFTQGPVDFRGSCTAAIAKGITVNTIHCGSEQDGRDGLWDEGARLADGSFLNIDQDAATVAIPTPYDETLAKLSERLNGTYIPFGAHGKERKEMQARQDANATAAAPGASAQRAIAKANAAYRNADWDLCDACTEKVVDLATAKDEDLPEVMRKMSLEEKKAYVTKKIEERKAIQDEIKKTSAERDAFIAVERKKQAEAGAETFETAVQKVLEEQMKKKGFEVERKH